MPMFKKGRDRLASVASLAANKGLLNEPGENNCFLNSAIQVLWHLDVFRRSFRLLHGHSCMGASCIFCALKDIFRQFQHSKAEALPPNILRSALAETFQQQNRFQLGLMDDAAECFENILLRMHVHLGNSVREDVCTAKHCIPHQKFGLSLVEQCVCQCGATSEPLPFIEMVHYVSASALCAEEEYMRRYEPSAKFGKIIRTAGSWGERRSCPSECGAQVDMRKVLMNCPDVVSVGIVWDSDEPQIQNISDLVHALGCTLRLSDLFHTVVDERASRMELYLVGMVCYYGKHYSTFFFHTKLRKWVYFDDAQVSEVGKRWSNVVSKCIKGHHQPLLLLYANPNGTPINNATAPDHITLLPGCLPHIGSSEGDSLSSEGELASFPDEENSGTESMQATAIILPPTAINPKAKSKSRIPENHHRANIDTTQVPKTTDKHKAKPRKAARTKQAENWNPNPKPLTPELVPPTSKEKRSASPVKVLPVMLPDRPPAAAKTTVAETQPTESGRKPTFQWNMASEKPRTTNINKVGQYVEPQPAQWTKYKPYPQANKAATRQQNPGTSPNQTPPLPVSKDFDVKAMDTKGMATFALTRKTSNTDSLTSASSNLQQATPPLSSQRLPTGDVAARRASVVRNTSQSSNNSSVGRVSVTSSMHENSALKRASPVSTTPNVSSTPQSTEGNPRTRSELQGATHASTNQLQAQSSAHAAKPKPPLPRKPPFLSIPYTAAAASNESPPTQAQALAAVLQHAYTAMHNPETTPVPFSRIPGPSQQYPPSDLNTLTHAHLPDNQTRLSNGETDPFSSPSANLNLPTAETYCAEKAESLLRDAEERIEQSRSADTLMDYSSALQLCLEATKMLEEVQMMDSVPTECMVQARIKHGECISKARILQRRKNIRMQARGKEKSGDRSSMTEADRHMVQSVATQQVASTSKSDVNQQPASNQKIVMEVGKPNDDLINFDRPGVSKLQHQVNQIYEHHNQIRKHPEYRPHTGLRPPHGNNTNTNNNNIGSSLAGPKPVVPSSEANQQREEDSRPNIFMWKHPEDEDEAVEVSRTPDDVRGASPSKTLANAAETTRGAKESTIDREIIENMKSLSTAPSQPRFRSKTPTPQTTSEPMSVAQSRRSKTPTPLSNKEILRARAGQRHPSDKVRPKSSYEGFPPKDEAAFSQKPNEKPSSNPEASSAERPSSSLGHPLPLQAWSPGGSMLSPPNYVQMYEMWCQYYNSLSPEQKNMLATNMPAPKPPVFPVSVPMAPPQSAMKAAYLESLKLQLNRNLKNFTNNVSQLPPTRSVNSDIYEQSKPKPIAKTNPPLRAFENTTKTRPPARRAPLGARPDVTRFPRPSDGAPPRGHTSPTDRNGEPQSSNSRQPSQARDISDGQPRQQGMMKWAEEGKKRAPGPGIPPQYKDKIIQDFRSKRLDPQSASIPGSSAFSLGKPAPNTNILPRRPALQPPDVAADRPASRDHGCELCGLVKVPISSKYCDSCQAYLSRFKPTVNSRR